MMMFFFFLSCDDVFSDDVSSLNVSLSFYGVS